MQRRESGTTRASMSHTIGFLNELRIFATRCFAGLTLCDSIRKRSKACFIPFFDIDVESFMRTYIAQLETLPGVSSVTLSAMAPLSGTGASSFAVAKGHPENR